MKRLVNSTLFLVLLLTVGLVVAIMEEVVDRIKYGPYVYEGKFRDYEPK